MQSWGDSLVSKASIRMCAHAHTHTHTPRTHACMHVCTLHMCAHTYACTHGTFRTAFGRLTELTSLMTTGSVSRRIMAAALKDGGPLSLTLLGPQPGAVHTGVFRVSDVTQQCTGGGVKLVSACPSHICASVKSGRMEGLR